MMHKRRNGELAVCYMCKNDKHELCDTGEYYYCHCSCNSPWPLRCVGKSRLVKQKLRTNHVCSVSWNTATVRRRNDGCT